jgi:hypothetical protein
LQIRRSLSGPFNGLRPLSLKRALIPEGRLALPIGCRHKIRLTAPTSLWAAGERTRRIGRVSDHEAFWSELLLWCQAVFRGWRATTMGGSVAAVVGTYLALSGATAEAVRLGALVVFTSSLALGAFRTWQDERRGRLRAEAENDALRASPQLRLVFVPGAQPYQQTHDRRDGGPAQPRYFRVGVTHDGLRRVEDIRVLLADLEPRPDSFPIMQALAVTHEAGGTASCAVAPGSDPTRFFDVLVQEVSAWDTKTTDDPVYRTTLHASRAAAVCFAAGGREMPAGVARVRLVAEGRDASSTELVLEVMHDAGRVVELWPAPAAAPGR